MFNSLARSVMNAIARQHFRGAYYMASLVARMAGKHRWLAVQFASKVIVRVDLGISKFWGLTTKTCEQGLGRFFMCALRPGDVVYDIGANWGFFTCLAAALVGETGAVAAFEPGERAFDQLRGNVAHAALWRVILKRCALAQVTGGSVPLVLPGWGHADTGAYVSSSPPSRRTEDVPTLALDDFWRQQGCPRLRLIKIDVEGAELQVLRGARQLLHDRACDYLVIETGIYAQRYGTRARDTVEFLSSCGYSHVLRFSNEPPYLVPLTPDRLEHLDDNICVSFEEVPFTDAVSMCEPPFKLLRPEELPTESICDT